jgi:hypothetical protein
MTPKNALFELESITIYIPNQSIIEDIPNLVFKSVRILRHHHTKSISKFSSIVKYHMSHYMYNHHLLESNMSFINQLYTVSIPNNMQKNLIWPDMENKYDQSDKILLEKIKHKNLLILYQEKTSWILMNLHSEIQEWWNN